MRGLVVLCLVGLVVLCQPGLAGANPIQAENALPGDYHWETARGSLGFHPSPTVPTWEPSPEIEGYASTTSVAPGETIDFHVSTQGAERYRIEVHRLGWYGGQGGRRLLCLPDPDCSTDKAGVDQPDPPAPDSNGMIAVDWTVTDSLTIPSNWVSGYYLAELIITSGPDAGRRRHVQFTVRAPDASPTAILVVVPVNTIQAYNKWGGKSLYNSGSIGPRANRVSFDRPTNPQDLSSDLFRHEYYLIRFLEREGYDVSYATNVDVHRDPSQLLDHSMVMTAGHDEYWTKEMRDGFEVARDAGVHLSFMGSNTAYWQVRYEDNERTVVGYKDNTDPNNDPELETILFRDLADPRPECELMGVMFPGGHRISSLDTFSRAYSPVAASLGDPLMEGTGFTAGTELEGLVGYEWDSIQPGCAVPGTVIPLLHWEGEARIGEGEGGVGSSASDAVYYVAPSGAQVFSTGSLQFTWGLDEYERPFVSPGVQEMVRNVIDVSGPQGSPHAVTAGSALASVGSATLNGTVHPNLRETTYTFEYGPTSAYGFRPRPRARAPAVPPWASRPH